jgi:PTS system, glucose subfamily, IIA component
MKITGWKRFKTNNKTIELSAPITGKIYPMEEIPDPVFADGILGKCCGIEPEEEIIFAPADGAIMHVAETGHALGLATESGLELMIHIGIDTVEMNGQGFEILVKPDEKVQKGQKLLKFSREAIETAGHSDMVIYAVTNADDSMDVQFLTDGTVKHLEKAGEVVRG